MLMWLTNCDDWLFPLQSSLCAARRPSSAGVACSRAPPQVAAIPGAQTHTGLQECTGTNRQVRSFLHPQWTWRNYYELFWNSFCIVHVSSCPLWFGILPACSRTSSWLTSTCRTLSQPPPRASQTSQSEFCCSWNPWPRVMRRSRTTWLRRMRWESRMRGRKPSSFSKQVSRVDNLFLSSNHD